MKLAKMRACSNPIFFNIPHLCSQLPSCDAHKHSNTNHEDTLDQPFQKKHITVVKPVFSLILSTIFPLSKTFTLDFVRLP